MFTVEADTLHELKDARLPLRPRRIGFVDIQRLSDNIGYRHARVQRGVWILKDHGGLFTEVMDLLRGADLFSVVENLAGGRFVQVQDGTAHRSLPTTRFADKAERLPLFNRERHAVHRLERLCLEHADVDVEILFQIAHVDQRQIVPFTHAFAPPSCAVSAGSSSSTIEPFSTPSLMFTQQAA